MVLSSSPHVMAGLLVSPPCSWDCAERHSKSSCDCKNGCAILEKLDYLCCRYCFILPVVKRTLAEHKTRDESVRKDKDSAISCGHHMKTIPFFGVVMLLPLLGTCYHFHLHQSRYNWFTIIRFNWLGIVLWPLSVPLSAFEQLYDQHISTECFCWD